MLYAQRETSIASTAQLRPWRQPRPERIYKNERGRKAGSPAVILCAAKNFKEAHAMEELKRREKIERIITKLKLLPPDDRERALTLLEFLAGDQRNLPCAEGSRR